MWTKNKIIGGLYEGIFYEVMVDVFVDAVPSSLLHAAVPAKTAGRHGSC
jgi:hypothetical protein